VSAPPPFSLFFQPFFGLPPSSLSLFSYPPNRVDSFPPLTSKKAPPIPPHASPGVITFCLVSVPVLPPLFSPYGTFLTPHVPFSICLIFLPPSPNSLSLPPQRFLAPDLLVLHPLFVLFVPLFLHPPPPLFPLFSLYLFSLFFLVVVRSPSQGDCRRRSL